MDQVTIETRAKINRGLKILGQRKDGYHLLQSKMVPIDLKDQIILKKKDKGLVYESNLVDLAWDKNNFCYKCLDLLEKKLNRKFHLEIHLEKKIPLGAGLAGGTANGAGILKGINQLYDLGLDLQTLQAWALDLGADFPFCLYDHPAEVEGIGEKIRPIQEKPTPLLLINPGYQLSTKEVYTWYDQDKDKDRDLGVINDLQEPVLRRHPDLVEVDQALKKTGAFEVSMSGSGPTFYGLYPSLETRDQAKKSLEGFFPLVIAGTTGI